jgi:hypothetical protein
MAQQVRLQPHQMKKKIKSLKQSVRLLAIKLKLLQEQVIMKLLTLLSRHNVQPKQGQMAY